MTECQLIKFQSIDTAWSATNYLNMFDWRLKLPEVCDTCGHWHMRKWKNRNDKMTSDRKIEEELNTPLVFRYTNHEGRTSFRTVIPKSIRFASTEWHPEKQWIMRAWCTEKKAMRDFAMKDMVDGNLPT